MVNETLALILDCDLLIVASYSVVCVFCIGVLIVATKGWHANLTSDGLNGVQKVHTVPTPRVGGVAIYLGLVFAVRQLIPREAGEILFALQFECLPALLVGLAEDITKRVSVLHRLIATMACGVVAWWLTGYSLTRLDIPLIDDALKVAVVSVLFTSFAIAGIANSINIIDGFNGLAALTSIFALLGLGLIAGFVGDQGLSAAAVTLAACVVGFLIINWPFGKLFLGDGGAYLLGFSIAWIAVMLVERNSTVSAFSALVICAHPVNEVLFTIYRRLQASVHPGRPDHKHLHSLVSGCLASTRLNSCSPLLRNSLTGGLVALLTLAAVVVATFTFHSTLLSLIAYVSLLILYIQIYHWL